MMIILWTLAIIGLIFLCVSGVILYPRKQKNSYLLKPTKPIELTDNGLLRLQKEVITNLKESLNNVADLDNFKKLIYKTNEGIIITGTGIFLSFDNVKKINEFDDFITDY